MYSHIKSCLGLTFFYVLSSAIVYTSFSLIFSIGRVKSFSRIGPHNIDILSIIFGSLLGDGSAEYRIKGKGTRICFYQEGSHVSYLIWLHALIADLGYCNPKIPTLCTRLGSKGKVRKILRFKTYTFTSFNWIYQLWYPNGVKIVPSCIGQYLTPLALAIWLMDDGSKVGSGFKFCTNCFSYSDCLLLTNILYVNFSLKASIQSAGAPNQFHIYILSESMSLLRQIVLPYVHPSMYYKLDL